MRSHITSTTPISIGRMLMTALVLGVIVFTLGVWVGADADPTAPDPTAPTQVCR